MPVQASITNEAMTELVEQYGNDMLRLALLYLGNREQAEDAVQDSFIKIFKSADTAKLCKAFIMRVLVNTCKDYRKSGWSRSVNLMDEMPEFASGDSVEKNESGARRDCPRSGGAAAYG